MITPVARSWTTRDIVDAMACDIQRMIFLHHGEDPLNVRFPVAWLGITVRRSMSWHHPVSMRLPDYVQTFAEVADALLPPAS